MRPDADLANEQALDKAQGKAIKKVPETLQKQSSRRSLRSAATT